MNSPFGSIPSTVTTAWPSRRSTLTVVSLRVFAQRPADDLRQSCCRRPTGVRDARLRLASAVQAMTAEVAPGRQQRVLLVGHEDLVGGALTLVA